MIFVTDSSVEILSAPPLQVQSLFRPIVSMFNSNEFPLTLACTSSFRFAPTSQALSLLAVGFGLQGAPTGLLRASAAV